MAEKPTHRKTRIVSVVAATAISLACGTNYAYSAWAPQFAEKLQLSATQSNIIVLSSHIVTHLAMWSASHTVQGTSANLGMYASGIPMGIITDRKSPRLAALIGMLALGVGYYPIYKAYDNGAGSTTVAAISFFSFISGVGSCAAFQGALKTATLNWPTHRGTATAFPLAAFGLSAFFYTMIAGFAFPGNTSGFLLLLSLGTSLLVLVAFPFLHVVDHQKGTSYAAVPTHERTRRDSNLLHRTRSNGSKHSSSSRPQPEPIAPNEEDDDSDETSSLLSGPGDIIDREEDAKHGSTQRSHWLDITGLSLLSKMEFWQLWILMGLLTGVGLMTINNIGHDVQALWNHYDDSANKDFVAHRQLMHVSIISVFSFLGRLSSGISSDVIVKRLHMSRFWCAAASATVFMFAQICAIRIENPNFLWAVSSLSGLAYGILFGVLPALVVDAFGADGFAVNWGFMTLAPVVSGNVYNLFYGSVYDAHSEVQPNGDRSCDEGLACYRMAYYVTLASSVLGIVACFWGIRHEHMVKKKKQEEEHEGHRDA